MATVTPGYTFTSNEVATPAKLNSAATPVVAVANGEITESKLANNAVTGAKIAVNAVTETKIANGSVTASKLAAGAVPIAIPAGAVMPFAMNSAPSGWLAANGSAVSRTTYADLFAAIGTTYGSGNGSSTFNLPDLRGYFVRGSGTNSDGTASGTFGAKQSDDIKSHDHRVFADVSGAENDKVTASEFPTVSSNNDGREDYLIGGTSTTATLGKTSTSGSETRPNNIAMLYCIKF